jgi:translation initiation factor 2B subunit (eIF-2B alpha/beta/delta family)
MDHHSFNRAIESIRSDRHSGASELARRCLSIAAESAHETPSGSATELKQLLLHQATQLATIRPSMTPIENLLTLWRSTVFQLPETELSAMRGQAAKAAHDLIEASRQAVHQCATLAAEHIGPNKTLFTHSLSSTVMNAFEQLSTQGVQAIITESRPLNEGYLLAKQLSKWRIPTTLITDAQMGLFISKADAVLVGADTLLTDGSLINKAGTYPLALLAHEHGVPFYVCCERFKQRTEAMGTPELEAMDINELQAPQLPEVTIQNTYFDITPTRMISAWFDENQMHKNSDHHP